VVEKFAGGRGHGRRGRTYMVSAMVYRHAGGKGTYVRQAGFDPIQQEQMVLAFIDRRGSIKRRGRGSFAVSAMTKPIDSSSA
jgi:ribulose bisphosphate carboxylase small subunit